MPWEWLMDRIRDGYERTTESKLLVELETGTGLEIWMKWAELLAWYSAYESYQVTTEETENSWGV